MASNRGKLFERELRKGLGLLPGMSIRLYDGTNVARIQMPGDFIYAAYSGTTWLIECKSTQDASLPYANFQDHQLPDLMRWAASGENGSRRSAVAVEYWRHGVAFVIDPLAVEYERTHSGRKSLPISAAARLGVEIPRIKADSGFAYSLGFLEAGGL